MENEIKINVVSETREYDGYLKIDRGLILEVDEFGVSHDYARYKLSRPDSVAVMLYNSDEDSVILVKQHRYPTHGKVTGDIFEIVAGKMDDGEEHIDTAKREVEEEVGYKVKDDNLLYMSSFFASPGYSSEIIHLYAATVSNDDKVSDGGGVDGEHENIKIVTVSATEFFNMFARGEIIDAKSIIGANALWHLRNQDRVKIGIEYYEKSRLEDARNIAKQVIDEEDADETSE